MCDVDFVGNSQVPRSACRVERFDCGGGHEASRLDNGRSTTACVLHPLFERGRAVENELQDVGARTPQKRKGLPRRAAPGLKPM